MINNLNYHNIKSSDLDDYLKDAGLLIIENNKASIGMLQRVFKIGFNRATHIMDQLCKLGVVGEEIGTKPRQILMDQDAFLDLLSNLPQFESKPYPSCGAATGSKIYSIYTKVISITYIKWINFLFPIFSIIVLLLFGFLYSHALLNDKPITFGQWLLFMIFTTVIIVLPFDSIRWFIWGKRKYLKKLQNRLNTFERATQLVAKANELSETINRTTDRNQFENSLTELKATLNEIIKYEKYGVFQGSTARQDLRDLLEKEPCTRKALEERIIDTEFLHTSQNQPRTYINFDNMDGHAFEYYCADILRKNQFKNVEVTQGSGDHGIDILAEKDDISYAIQCKCYSSNIGNAAVQQAHTGKSIYQKDIAVVLTNQYFTEQAKSEAAVLGVKLWDRDKLTSLINSAS